MFATAWPILVALAVFAIFALTQARNDATAVRGFFALALCVALVVTVLSSAWWRQLSAEAEAAWVQAVGSILAVVGAAVIARLQNRVLADRELRQMRRRGFALAVEIRGPLDDWYKTLPKIFPQDGEEAIAMIWETGRSLHVPQQILPRTERMPDLEDAGIAILRCVSRTYEMQKMFHTAEARRASLSDERQKATAKLYWRAMRAQRDDLTFALKHIVNLIDA